MIRQAISCDVCGAEKKLTNHWFVACESGGELRLSGWNSRMRQRAGTRHLCGQTCLHKLVDEFIARSINARMTSTGSDSLGAETTATAADTSLLSPAVCGQSQSSARIVTGPPPLIAVNAASHPSTAVLLPMQPRLVAESSGNSVPLQPENVQYTSRSWRAQAWERERNRELRATDRHGEPSRRRSLF